MPILDEFGREMTLQPQNMTFSNPEPWFIHEYCMPQSASGVTVTDATAMRVSAVFACIRNISDDVAKLPLKVYRRKARGKEVASNLPIYRLLHDAPNPGMSAFHFRQYLTACACGPGNGYAEIVRSNGGQVSALFALDCNRVTTKWDRELGLYHEYQQPTGQKVLIQDRDMLHIHGPGDGVVGYSMVRLARETIGNAIAIDKATGSSMGNDGTPGGVLKLPGTLSDSARKTLREEWEAIHRGAENRRRTAVLEGGVEFAPVSFSADDMQFIEQAHHSIEEIARWWRMPPHKIGHLLRATNNNIEHQALEYVQDCLSTWLVVWEQEIARKLFPADNKTLFAEHVVEGLLRGDQAARGAFYNQLLQMGALTPNEIREKENMNPGDAAGDRHYMQSNMAPLDLVAEGVAFKKNEPKEEPKPTESDDDEPKQPANRIAPVVNAMKPVIADALRRSLKATQSNVLACAKKAGGAQKREELFAELPAAVTSTLDAPVQALATSLWLATSMETYPQTAESVISTVLGDFAKVHVAVLAMEATEPEKVSAWGEELAANEADSLISGVAKALSIPV